MARNENGASREIATEIRKANMIVHRHVSEGIFKIFHPSLVRIIGERYKERKWDFFFGDESDHVTAYKLNSEILLLVKTTRDFEEKYVMLTQEEFLRQLSI